MNIIELRRTVDETPDMEKADTVRYRLKTTADLAREPSPPWLIVDLLPARGLAVRYGEPASGKSFLALDIAAHLARRRYWAGRRTRRAKVVYVALEGHLRDRVAAYKQHHGLTDADLADLLVVQGQTLNLLDKNTVPALVADVKAQLADYTGDLVVVVDTLARAMPGGSENASEDMGRVIEAGAQIERELQALVLLIHHSGKDAARGARGWSGLRGAADAEIVVERDGDRRRASFAKVKDGQDGHAVEFVLEVVDLGPRDQMDADADPDERVTSCVAVVTDTQAKPKVADKALGKNQRLLLTALRNEGPWSRSQCHDFLRAAGVARNRRHEAVDSLLTAGVIEDTVLGLRAKT